jgi:hypothetical protein
MDEARGARGVRRKWHIRPAVPARHELSANVPVLGPSVDDCILLHQPRLASKQLTRHADQYWVRGITSDITTKLG